MKRSVCKVFSYFTSFPIFFCSSVVELKTRCEANKELVWDKVGTEIFTDFQNMLLCLNFDLHRNCMAGQSSETRACVKIAVG